MKIFKDGNGLEWTLELNITAVKRVRDLVGADLLDFTESGPIFRMQTDDVLLADVLFALVKPQADSRSITDAQFGSSMWGDALGNGCTALIEEMTSFCRNPQQRTALRRVVDAIARAQERAMAVLEERTSQEAIDAIVDREIAAALNGSGTQSGAPPACSGSTPET